MSTFHREPSSASFQDLAEFTIPGNIDIIGAPCNFILRMDNTTIIIIAPSFVHDNAWQPAAVFSFKIHRSLFIVPT